MKIASWKLVLATTLLAIVGVQSVPTPPTDGFTPEEQSIWLDHHNFFRMTALPYSAANMLRMKWNADLATQAATEAKACTIISKPGVNLHVCQSNETKALIDHTFTNWAVKPALASVKSLKPPRAGDPVGVGVYNSYSQIVWSSSCEVGCARVSCGDGTTGVACKYSVPGNDGTSPWYTHGEPASACPAGTTPKVGLCVKADADYGIPTPETSKAQYVFKDFIPEVQKLLTGQAAPAKIGTAETTDDTTAGKVKPYDASAEHRGSVPSPATPSTPDQPSPASPSTPDHPAPAPAPTPIPGTEVTTPATEPTPANPHQADTPSGATPASVVSVANNKSEQNVSAGGFSAAGLAGCVVLGLFFVAGVAVFVSYRRNQKRQRDIMQNGGIHIL